MNSPSSASPSWPKSATSSANLASSTPAHTESSVPDVITIMNNSDGQVYNIQKRGKPDKPFDMEYKPANDSVQVKSFVWYISDPKAKPEERDAKVFAEADAQNGTLFQNSDADNKTFICLNVTDVDKNHHDELNKAMVIGIHWTFGKQEGETFSRAFSITPDEDAQRNNNVWGKVMGSYYNITRESIQSGGSGSGGYNGFTPPNNRSDDNNSNDNGTSDMPTIGGNSSSSQTHNRRGGLGTGAIAGIAVGIAALLAAALGIFFFLRRRRGRGTSSSTTALHHTHAAAGQEKLSSFANGGVAGGASASDAAIAPYRDDNSTLTNSHDRRRSSAATGRVVAPGEDVARDQQPSPPKTTTAAAESRHSRTSNGVARHLVEEGMTAEEIRQLEEEEAQLDEAIQRRNDRTR